MSTPKKRVSFSGSASVNKIKVAAKMQGTWHALTQQ